MTSASSPTVPAARGPRLLHVDGLRAVAAVAVALFHFHGYLPLAFATVPTSIDTLVAYGYLGVNVFFVLSGFVIAHSLSSVLRTVRVTPRFVLRYFLRRQVRLDPPYWVVLALAAASLSRTPNLPEARLAARTLGAHVLYLQNIVGLPNVLDVFWTLCIEVQLYLAYVLLVWLAQAISRRADARRAEGVLLALTTLASLGLCLVPMPARIGAWFVWYWYMFALGVYVRRALDDPRALWLLAVFSLLAAGRAYRYQGPGPMVCVATAWLLVMAWRSPSVARVLSWRPLVLLGTVSYSFYLLHALVGAAAIRTVLEGGPATVARSWVALGAALVASVGGAAILYATIEVPAMRWSRQLAGALDEDRGGFRATARSGP